MLEITCLPDLTLVLSQPSHNVPFVISMNLLPQFLTESTWVLAFAFIAFLISLSCVFQLLALMQPLKQSQNRLTQAENQLNCLEKNLDTLHILNRALINSSQAKNNVELCHLLLENCIHKSEVLTAKAVINNLHFEINNAVAAIKSLEEKRIFLEGKIKQTFDDIKTSTNVAELEQSLQYAKALLTETALESDSTEQMKHNVFKVNRILEQVLLKV